MPAPDRGSGAVPRCQRATDGAPSSTEFEERSTKGLYATKRRSSRGQVAGLLRVPPPVLGDVPFCPTRDFLAWIHRSIHIGGCIHAGQSVFLALRTLHPLGEAPSRLNWPADLRRYDSVADASVDPGLVFCPRATNRHLCLGGGRAQ